MGIRRAVDQCFQDLAVPKEARSRFKACVLKELDGKTSLRGGLRGHGPKQPVEFVGEVACKVIDELQDGSGSSIKTWSFLQPTGYCRILPTNKAAKLESLVQLMKFWVENINQREEKQDPPFPDHPIKASERRTDYLFRHSRGEPGPVASGHEKTTAKYPSTEAGPSSWGAALNTETEDNHGGVDQANDSSYGRQKMSFAESSEADVREKSDAELPELSILISGKYQKSVGQKPTSVQQPIHASIKGKAPMRPSYPGIQDTTPSRQIQAPTRPYPLTPVSGQKRRWDRDATITREDTESGYEEPEPSPAAKRRRTRPSMVEIDGNIQSSQSLPSPTDHVSMTEESNVNGSHFPNNGQEQTRSQPAYNDEEDETITVSNHETTPFYPQDTIIITQIDEKDGNTDAETEIETDNNAHVESNTNHDIAVNDNEHDETNKINEYNTHLPATANIEINANTSPVLHNPAHTPIHTTDLAGDLLTYFETCWLKYLDKANDPQTSGTQAAQLQHDAALLHHVCSDTKSRILASEEGEGRGQRSISKFTLYSIS